MESSCFPFYRGDMIDLIIYKYFQNPNYAQFNEMQNNFSFLIPPILN
jgi:hypothetical protein